MRTVVSITALALVALVGAAAAAGLGAANDDPTVAPIVITNPDWLEKPSGEQLADIYPATAQTLRISGSATLDCAVEVDGHVSGCQVIFEKPVGFGFGPAALATTPFFRMRPQMIDGNAVGGARVKIPISFVLPPNRAVVVPSDTPRIAEPTPAAKALARQIVDASGRETPAPVEVMERIWNLDRLAKATPKSPADGQVMAAANQAYRRALEDAREAFASARAEAIAQTFTAEDLKVIVAFTRTPAGQAWVSRQGDVDALEEARTAELLGAAAESARREVCSAAGAGKAPPGCAS